MQKVVSFLEKYVQWVAIALGVAFLLWMIYGYVIQKPVTVVVAGSTLTPGQVDEKTLTGPVRNLSTLIQANTAPPMPVQDFYTTLAQSLSEATSPVVAMNKPWTSKFYDSTNTPIDVIKQTVTTRLDPVVELPAAPAPFDLKTSDGRSTVTIPLPAVAGAPPAPPVAGAGVDVNWITVGATIPVKKLADNFAASKIPAEAGIVTTLLRVELQRQEQNGDGSWGPETVVEPLKNVTMLPLPGADSKPTEQYAYDIWAQGDQVDIAQPAYYPVIQGDAWRIPGGQIPIDAAAAAAEAAFDPSKVTNTRDLTPDQRKLYDAYQRQQDQAKRDAARQKYLSRKSSGVGTGPGGPPGMPPGGGIGPPGGFGGGGAPDVVGDNTPPILLAQAGRPGYPPGYPGSMPRGFMMPPNMPGMMPPGMMPPGMDGMPGMPQPGSANTAVDAANAALLTAAQATLPKGSFVPSAQPDIAVWVHDASVLPGKTYHYRIRYYLKNPVYQTSGVCKKPELALQFMLTSEYSDWTEAVSVKSVTNFYAVNASPTKDAVKFDIFRWKNGNWQVNSIEATPGDMVGAPKGDGADKVDFTTGWTLVDVRSDPRNADNKIIVLTTDSGQILRKDLQADRSNTEYKNLKSLVDKATPATPGTPANPTAGRPTNPSASAGGQGGLFGDAAR